MATKIFVSYSHKDKDHLADFTTHLSMLRRKGLIDAWTDEAINPGERWYDKIKEQIAAADIVVFLVSPDFLASDFIYDHEIKDAMEQYNQNKTSIVPILLRTCDFENSELRAFQALPSGAKPITKWDDKDEAWNDVIKGLKKLIKEPQSTPVRPSTQSNPDKSAIRDWISQGKLSKAIEQIKMLSENQDETIYNSSILLSSRLSSLERNDRMGIISSSDSNMERNRITYALLSLVDEL